MHYNSFYVLSVLSAVLLTALAAPPAPLWGDIRVKHTWGEVPVNWKSLGPPPASTTIDLHMALKPRHEDALIDALYEVSDPSHRKYGAHLSREEVAELVAPHQDTLEIVQLWLEHHGVPSSSISTSHGGGWLTITGVPVSQADELLGASYQLYKHNGTNETEAILRTVSYGLPAALHAHVQTIAPTTHFSSPRRPRQIKRPSKEAEAVVNATSGERVGSLFRRAGYHVTPPFLRWLYKTQAYVPPETTWNALGALGLHDDFPKQEDLTIFMNNFRGDAEAAAFTVVTVNGGSGYDPTNPAVPASIQIQYAEAMAYPAPYIFYSAGGGLQWSHSNYKPVPGDSYLEWLNFLVALPNDIIPPTISITYTDPEPDFPRAYARALCILFSQLGVRGVSILASSGNDGVGRGDCRNRYHQTWFIPMFPASCPWVTSVGGTTRFGPEVGAFLSGGGFSRHFPRARYQNKNGAVPNFLQTIGSTYSSYYQNTGRGIPDVSAQALRFVYVHNSLLYELNGTDCAVSTVAGIVSLLNAHRLSIGSNPLGFLNPWLYGKGIVGLEDIVSGSNPGCGTPGFSAVAGWDPVTGLGTLNFAKLLPLAQAPHMSRGL